MPTGKPTRATRRVGSGSERQVHYPDEESRPVRPELIGLMDHLPLQLQLRWGVERLDLHGQEGLAEPGRLPQVIRVLFEVTSRRWMALGFGLRE